MTTTSDDLMAALSELRHLFPDWCIVNWSPTSRWPRAKMEPFGKSKISNSSKRLAA